MQTQSRRLKARVKAVPRVKIEPQVKAEERKGVIAVKTEENGVFSRRMPKLEVDFSSETNTTRRRQRRPVRNIT